MTNRNRAQKPQTEGAEVICNLIWLLNATHKWIERGFYCRKMHIFSAMYDTKQNFTAPSMQKTGRCTPLNGTVSKWKRLHCRLINMEAGEQITSSSPLGQSRGLLSTLGSRWCLGWSWMNVVVSLKVFTAAFLYYDFMVRNPPLHFSVKSFQLFI